jgi:adenosylcobyric acid synthase
MATPALMVQGTGSDVGKSLLVAGLARALRDRGLRVRPFKPQNMSNNAAVTADGGEIGRAQALQALAAGVAPMRDMNPILLKPDSETGAQLIVRGQVRGRMRAAEYHAAKPALLAAVRESFARLAAEADLVLVEGAGSAAEINLRAGDIANMGFALAESVPVVLVGDIDKGGVIASLVGTVALLEPAERALLRGFIVNKFRGDRALFAEGMAVIAARTGLPGLGLVPWFEAARRLPAEDTASLDSRRYGGGGALRIVVPRLPRIANFDDLDPLAAEPGVSVSLIEPGEALPESDLIVLPGSKATRADLAALRGEGWDIDILAHRRRGGFVLGLCGGYQMLGRSVSDPLAVEGESGESIGLGLLELDTTLGPEKRLARIDALDRLSRARVTGYEIHVGRSDGPATSRPLLDLDGHAEGARSEDGRVAGCYIHGLFASDAFRADYLDRLRAARGIGSRGAGLSYGASIEAALDQLAAHLEASLDLDRLVEVARAR